jgi:hypothetical protein
VPGKRDDEVVDYEELETTSLEELEELENALLLRQELGEDDYDLSPDAFEELDFSADSGERTYEPDFGDNDSGETDT